MPRRDPTAGAALRAGALGQHGCFTTHQARAAGVSDGALRTLLRRGEAERVHLGVYRFTTARRTWESMVWAALAAAGSAAAVSHASAALLLGLRGLPRGRPEVTVPGTSLPEVHGVRVHRTRELPDIDVVEVAGMRCTTGSRTLVDLAGRLTVTRRIQLVDEAICGGIATRSNLHARALALAPGRKGVVTLVSVTAPGAEGTFWSALERRFGAGVSSSRLPPPSYNAPVRWAGRTYFVDALWEAARLVVELHGLRFHHTPAQRRDDGERANALTLAGYRQLVFTWQDVAEDLPRVLAMIAGALGVSAQRPG